MNNDIKRIAPSTGTIEQVAALNKTNYTGSLRRGKNGKLYVIAPSLFNWFWTNSSKIYQYANVDDPVVGNITPGTISLNTGSPTGGISYQPFFKGSMNFYQHKNQREVGNKVYELADHLGNVRAVVSDRRMATINSGNIVGYSTDVKAWNDYYAFGGQMPGRMDGSGGSYRYGFQGQEKDDEAKGSGNQINFEHRVHDPRLGRFMSVDPISRDYPWNSPYAFSENRVIDGVEFEGLEYDPVENLINYGAAKIRAVAYDYVENLTNYLVESVRGTLDKTEVSVKANLKVRYSVGGQAAIKLNKNIGAHVNAGSIVLFEAIGEFDYKTGQFDGDVNWLNEDGKVVFTQKFSGEVPMGEVVGAGGGYSYEKEKQNGESTTTHTAEAGLGAIIFNATVSGSKSKNSETGKSTYSASGSAGAGGAVGLSL